MPSHAMLISINIFAAYVLKKETGDLKLIILATGSEVHVAVEAAKRLGDGVRVVSVPSTYRYDQQTAEYKESVLPSSIRRVRFSCSLLGASS